MAATCESVGDSGLCRRTSGTPMEYAALGLPTSPTPCLPHLRAPVVSRGILALVAQPVRSFLTSCGAVKHRIEGRGIRRNLRRGYLQYQEEDLPPEVWAARAARAVADADGSTAPLALGCPDRAYTGVARQLRSRRLQPRTYVARSGVWMSTVAVDTPGPGTAYAGLDPGSRVHGWDARRA